MVLEALGELAPDVGVRGVGHRRRADQLALVAAVVVHVEDDLLVMLHGQVEGLLQQAHLVEVQPFALAVLHALPEEREANQADALLTVVGEVLFLGIEVVRAVLAWHDVRCETGAGQVHADQVDTALRVLGRLHGQGHEQQRSEGGSQSCRLFSVAGGSGASLRYTCRSAKGGPPRHAASQRGTGKLGRLCGADRHRSPLAAVPLRHLLLTYSYW